MVSVSSTDFDNIADDVGETITIYSPSQTFDSDYGAIDSHTLGSGTQETAIVQPMTAREIEQTEGIRGHGHIKLFLKQSTNAAKDSMIQVDGKSNFYRIIELMERRPGGTVHHYEAVAKFLR